MLAEIVARAPATALPWKQILENRCGKAPLVQAASKHLVNEAVSGLSTRRF